MQVAGLPQPGHQSILRSLEQGELEFYLDDGRLVAAAGLGAGKSLAKEIKLSEMLIAAGICPDPAALPIRSEPQGAPQKRTGGLMRRLHIFQSLWAMERRHTDGHERSLAENIAMIAEAGFDGIGAHYTKRADVVALNDAIRGTGLRIEGVCFPRSVDDLRLPLELAAEFPVNHINLQPDVRLRRVEDCLPLLDGWMRLAEEAGIPVFIETHRDRMTTDLFFALDLLDRRPDLPLLADLSHFLVGREFAFPVEEENHALIRRILDNAQAFHGRVASREQVRESKFPFRTTAPGSICSSAGGITVSANGAPGPPRMRHSSSPANSAQNPMRSPAGTATSTTDRWPEALLLRDMVRDLWDARAPARKPDATSRGSPKRARSERAAVVKSCRQVIGP